MENNGKVISFRNNEEKFVQATVDSLNDIIEKIESGEYRCFLGVVYSKEDGVIVYYSKPEGTSIYELLGYTELTKDYLLHKAAMG